MKNIDYKSLIEANKTLINFWLKKNPLKKAGYIGWAKHEVFNENKALIPVKPGISNCQLEKMLNFTYMTNQQKVYDYIVKTNFEMNGESLKNMHDALCENTSVTGGLFRTANCRMMGMKVLPPDYTTIRYRLDKVYDYMLDSDMSPVSKAIKMHVDIVTIQPFQDYNKRTARMAMNWALIQNGYTPILFRYRKDRTNYLNAIENRDKLYDDYMLKTMLRTQNEILRVLGHSV